jgi:hypothetical protein
MPDIAESLIAAQQKLANAHEQSLKADYIAIVESAIALARHAEQIELWAWRQIRARTE